MSHTYLNDRVALLLRVFDSASTTLCHVSSSVLCLRLLQYLQHYVTVSVRKALSQRRTVVYQVTSVAEKNNFNLLDYHT